MSRSSTAPTDAWACRFASFGHAAEEAAIARLYGGIHYRRAITEGLRQGDRTGAAVTSAFDQRR